jgi:hypothetical protein
MKKQKVAKRKRSKPGSRKRALISKEALKELACSIMGRPIAQALFPIIYPTFPVPMGFEYRNYMHTAYTSKVRKPLEEALAWAKHHGVYDVANIAARRLKDPKLRRLHEINKD